MITESSQSGTQPLPDVPGYPQYKPSSVTQFPDAAATSVPYKPTFKPYVPDANDSKFTVDNGFILEELSTEEPVIAASLPDTVDIASNDTIAALAAMISEKVDFGQIGESATKYINQLSNNSLVNLLVIFGIPIITAVLSVMGAGPLAIATMAWIVPIASVLVLPDLVQR